MLLILLGLSSATAWIFGGEVPTIQLAEPVKAIGMVTAIRVRVDADPSVRSFRATVEQGGQSYVALLERQRMVRRWRILRPHQPERFYLIEAGRRAFPQLKDGPAKLVLEAQTDDWRGRTATVSIDLTVKTTPPSITTDSGQHYINQGGSEMAVFQVSPDATDAGVRVGMHQFGAWVLPGGGSGARFAIFAFPYDVKPDTAPVLFARDVAGNEATAAFPYKLFPKKFRNREIELTDDFMKKVTSEILAKTKEIPPSGDLLKDFLAINRTLRQENNVMLAELRLKTQPRFLWTKPFRQLSDSKVEAQFADHRLYMYKGQKVDEQDHLGFDLAVTANVAVVAANDGQVVHADYLGIYGNCIVIDHGYGLQSIYGHLSSIGVKTGDNVKQGQEIGRSGATGLAGGDHLHFGMQVDGVQVNPVEWWDAHWIRDRIAKKFPEGRLPGT